MPLFFLAYLAQTPLFCLAFSKTPEDVFLACSFSAFLVFFLFGSAQMISYAVLYIAPSAGLAQLFRMTGPPWDLDKKRLEFFVGNVLMVLGFGIVLAISILCESNALYTAWKEQGFSLLGKETLESAVALDQLIDKAFFYLPALTSISWMWMTFCNLALSQACLRKFYKAPQNSLSIKSIEIPAGAYWCLVGSLFFYIVFGTQGARLGENLCIVSLFPFLIAGLVVIHKISPRFLHHKYRMVGLYIFLFLFLWPLCIVVLLGFLEPWLAIVEKLKNKQGDRL